MEEKEIIERLTKAEERSKSNTHRLDKLEPIINEIHIMSRTMVQLVEEVRHTNETVSSLDEKVEQMDSRMDELEKEPGKRWVNMKTNVFNTVLGVVIGFLATGLIWAAVQAF